MQGAARNHFGLLLVAFNSDAGAQASVIGKRFDPQHRRGRFAHTASHRRGTPVSKVSAIAQIRALEHEMFEEVQHKPLPASDDELRDIDNVIFSGDEDEQISVRVCVGDSPEEVVDVDPTADVVQTLTRALGIEGATVAR